MWILFAFGSAFFAGITSVLAKFGIKQTDSNLATATRTVVVLVMAFLMPLVVSSLNTIYSLNATSGIFLVLSGLSTGASWLCYFTALQNGDINKAQEMLDNLTPRTVEWHYLQSIVFYKKNWFLESKKQLEFALSLDPQNMKYKNSLEKLNKILASNAVPPEQMRTTSAPAGNGYTAPAGNGTCTGSCCGDGCLANLCCECCGRGFCG